MIGGAVIEREITVVKLEGEAVPVPVGPVVDVASVDDDGAEVAASHPKHRLSIHIYRSASWELWTESR